MGLIPWGTILNRDFRFHMIELATDISDEKLLILFDAQTSGGLLISVPERKAHPLIERLRQHGVDEAAIIGEILDEPKGKIIIT